MKPFSFQHKLGRVLLSWIQHYNHEKYWKQRAIVINPNDKTYLLLKVSSINSIYPLVSDSRTL